MAGFSELIKNFDKTRDYVRDFFIYGYKVRGDFNKKSARTYDDEKRRVESWLGEHLVYDDSVRGKQVAISVDSAHITENPLYQAFYTRSFTENDVRMHFLTLDILCDGEEHTAGELCSLLGEAFGFSPEEQTLRLKLKEYAEEGIVLSRKQGKSVLYRLSPDLAENILDSEGMYDMVKFFSEAAVFGVAGNSILRLTEQKNEHFCIKHNYIVHVLEDEVMLIITEAMAQHRLLTVGSFKNDVTHNVLPMQVITSVQTGRRFLAAYSPGGDKYMTFRLDYMPRPKAGAVFDNYDEIKTRYDELCARSFGVSFAETKDVEPLVIVIYADEVKEQYIIDRLKREKRCGTLEKTGENEFTLTLDICDPTEAMKWVKTFIGRIKRLEGGTESLRKRFYSDIKRMYEMYGGDDDEDIQ
ncbi:WYL domain-containing protein [Ruminococcus sp.]|uniref:WYL domain-containing protein n=1 Tax=Ruminococcus sp. TaxID=41978 RepID=UPI0025DA65E4|nr:WYL domain-containing protein [Ruminococcus sp.]MBQ8966686.1 WYL domain-containing protein [Ruminococcus sp.]